VYAMLKPDVLIIDEVLAVGDVAFRVKCLNAVSNMMRNSAVVFVSHSMPQVYRVCSEVMVLDHGSPVFNGHDIAAGVSRYLGLAKDTAVQLSGTLEVKLRRIRLWSSQDVQSGCEVQVRHNDQLNVEVELEADFPVPHPQVQFLLWNSEMWPAMELLDGDLRGGAFTFGQSGLARVHCHLDSVSLGPGRYSLSVIVTSRAYDVIYLRHDNAGFVDVVASTASGACVIAVSSFRQYA